MIDPSDPADLVRARRGIEALFAGVLGLGGTITGEHGVGLVKRDFLYGQLGEPQMELQRSIKRLFDPANLFNPGKKIVAGPEASPNPGTPSSTG
jgi:FAD/FMN-containing dehydrogenase